MAQYLDNEGLLYLWNKIKTYVSTNGAKYTLTRNNNVLTFKGTDGTDVTITFGTASMKSVATSVTSGSTDLPTGGAVATYVEGKGYKKITTGTTLPTSGNEGDVFLLQGVKKDYYTQSEIDSLLDEIQSTLTNATTTTDGLMSSSDKTKLDGIAEGANKYVHPSYTAKASGLYKVTVDSTGHVSAATAVTKSDITALGIPSSDTNTHYESKNVVGSATATSNTSSALSNGNVYLNSVENGAVTSSHKISGSGATTVTTDSSGNIIISSTDNNTVYTHPTYTARTGVPTANQTPSFGGTFSVNQVTSDGTGHVTGVTSRTVTIPSTLSNGSGTAGLIKTSSTVTSNSGYTACPVISGVPYYKDTNTTYSVASSSANGLMSSTDKAKLDAFGSASTYALKSDITGMYKYKGSVTNESNLPTSATTGDVYNIVNASSYGGAGMNVVWTGTEWDALGEVFSITSITNSEIDAICV